MAPGQLTEQRITIRSGNSADSSACAGIVYDAYAELAAAHAFPTEAPSAEFTTWKVAQMLAHPGFSGAVAEDRAEVVGAAFLDERSSIRGIGPVAVAPRAQGRGVGRALLQALLTRAEDQRAAGVRLILTGYDDRSLALCTSLGFAAREPLTVLQGSPIGSITRGSGVRRATTADIEGCDALCRRVHGHSRRAELVEALEDGRAVVVDREGRVTAYATGFGSGAHAVATANSELYGLLGTASAFLGLGIVIPTRNTDLLTWCLGRGLRIVQQSMLMSLGLYNHPVGAYLPSMPF